VGCGEPPASYRLLEQHENWAASAYLNCTMSAKLEPYCPLEADPPVRLAVDVVLG
jgi:hypothetical protein